MKSLSLILSLLLSSIALAEDRYVIDVTTLDRLPTKRHAALVLHSLITSDGSPEIHAKCELYYEALRRLAEELHRAYYWHDEFPADVFAGIDDRAAVLVAAQYPASPTTGCSYVAGLQDSYRIKMAEQVICAMAQAICDRMRDTADVEVIGGASFTYANWLDRWTQAGSVEDGPNQALQTTPMTRSVYEKTTEFGYPQRGV